MGRKRIPASQRREVISISLKPAVIASMDDYLSHDQSRSKWIEHIIEKHLAIQKVNEKTEDIEPKVIKSYSCYCEDCDITFSNPHSFLMQSHYCTKCHTKCEYLGEDE